MIARAWAIIATRSVCSWTFSGYVLCINPQRLMNLILERYAKKWLTPAPARMRSRRCVHGAPRTRATRDAETDRDPTGHGVQAPTPMGRPGRSARERARDRLNRERTRSSVGR